MIRGGRQLVRASVRSVRAPRETLITTAWCEQCRRMHETGPCPATEAAALAADREDLGDEYAREAKREQEAGE